MANAYPGVAYRVHLVEQLKRDPGATWGNNFASQNCGVSTDAMSAERATLGRLRYSGADLRQMLGDKSGGTNLAQSKAVLARLGVSLETHLPGRFTQLEEALRQGRGANMAGYYAPVQGTSYQGSETFTGNHRVWVNEARGWSRGSDGLWHAEEFLVFDPLADARRNGIDQGPTWWPRALVYSYGWRLDVSDPAEPYRPLPKGTAYFGLVRDTEPHVELRYGGARTSPFPDRTRATAPAGKRVNVRRAPNRDKAPVRTLASGALFVAWQRTTTGERLAGSRVWYGDQDGNEWVHAANLTYKGGST